MTASLPGLPSLEQLRRQAKDLVKQFKSTNAEAARRVQSHLPRAARLPAETLFSSGLTLTEAQRVLASEYGFPSWARLKRHVESSRSDPEAALSAFKRAIEDGDTARLKALLGAHPELKEQINAPLFSFDSPAILIAASRADRKTVDLLLEHGADINARSQWWAGGFGVLPHSDPEFGSYLISRGAIVDVWAAAGMNRLERLAKIIRDDPSRINARGGDGQGPLHFAGSIDVARFLLDHGAEIDLRDVDHHSTPAQHMAADRPEICRYLLSRGAELDIFMAVQLGDIELVRQALAADRDSLQAQVGRDKLTSGDSNGGHIYLYTLRNGHSPLFLATELDHHEIRDLLLAQGSMVDRLLAACLAADEQRVREVLAQHPDIVRSLDPEHMRLIADAAWAHKTDAVRLMLKIGFDVDARGDHESTALNRAAVRGFADLIELLLEHGASLEAKNEFGGKPLGACLWGAENFRDPNGDYASSVEKLLAADAPLSDVRFPNQNKQVNAILKRYLERLARANIIAAIKLGSEEQVTTLLERDSGLADRRTDDMLPLLQAVRSNRPAIVRILLAHGADPGAAETHGGLTAAELAQQAGNSEIMDLLASLVLL